MDIILRRKEINGVEYFVELTRIGSYLYHKQDGYCYPAKAPYGSDAIGITAEKRTCYDEKLLNVVANYHRNAQLYKVNEYRKAKMNNHKAHTGQLYMTIDNHIVFNTKDLEKKLWEYTKEELQDIIYRTSIDATETNNLYVKVGNILRRATIKDNKLYVYDLTNRTWEFYTDLLNKQTVYNVA